MTPKYMNKFAVTPPCSRPPLAPGQEADPTSIKRGEEFPEEWAKREAKLAKQAKDAVKKFNADSTAAAAEASVRPKKSMAKKPAHKPSASSSMPSRPISSAKPYGQFLKPLLLLQSPQLLRQNPQHMCILPRAKGLQASLLPQELELVPQLQQILQ